MPNFTPEEINKRLLRAGEKIAILVANKARGNRYAPYKSGDLERSIEGQATSDGKIVTVVVGTSVKSPKGYPYGAAQEGAIGHLKKGTAQAPYRYRSGAGRLASRPFLSAALHQSKSDIRNIIGGVLRGNL